MKKIKFLSLAVAALMMAACSSDEIASVAQKGSAPLEIVPVVKTQTRAAQITMDNLTALTVDVTGTFVTADGNDVVNPVLTLAKSGSTWSYTYNGDNAGPLYWPNNAETATFSAHTLADGATVNELTAQTDVVGDYTTKTFDGTNNPGAVALELKHAVSKMQFKARIQGEAADELKVKIDIKQVAVRAMNYAATYAKPAAAEATMGVLALGDSPAKADLTVASASAGTFITLNTTDATASTDLGHLFMVPQTVTAETLSESTWDDSYIAVYAQIRTVQGDVETMVFPTVGAVDETSYAWVAVPMPADFTQMQAHHKYIFTINFSADALGKVDRNQEPVIPGGGEDIEIEGRSSQPVTVTVENVYDFEEDGVEVNDLAPLYADRLVQLDAGLAVNFNSYENANASDHPMGMDEPVGTGLWNQNTWPNEFNGLVLTIEQATALAMYQADKIGQPCFVIYNANFTNSDTSDMTAETVYFVRSNGSLGTQRTYNNVSSVGQYGYYVSK